MPASFADAPDASDATDVTILGAGVIGVCAALAALEEGASVTVLDRGPPGAAASHGNAGVISPWSCVPQCIPGVWKNVPRWLLDAEGPVKFRWRDLGATLPWALRFFGNATPAKVARIADVMDALVRDNARAYRRFLTGTGRDDLIADCWAITAYRGATRPSLDEWQWRLRRERGAPIEIVPGGALREIEPALSPDYTSAVLLKDQARAIDPGGLCRALAEKATRLGAAFHTAEVTAIAPTPEGGVTLKTTTGAIDAKRLVLAAGAWSAALLRPLGYRLPLIAERGYHLEFETPGVSLRHSIQDTDAKVYLSSMAGGVRIAGTAEFAALDAPPNFARARALSAVAKRVAPGLVLTPAKEWMGSRPSLPDNLPAIGPLERHPQIIAAFGHSHWGLGQAPATARLVADALRGRRPNSELSAAVSPSRWTRA